MRTELDLHGYQVVEAIDIFVQHYNQRVKRGDLSPISVIHGYGSTGEGGRIRTALLKFLQTSDGNLSFQQEAWNPGKTVIYPEKVLPSGAGIVSSEIVAYCHLPRSESKILGKFRRFGDLNVKNTLRRLVKQGILSRERKGRLTVYSKI
ncbi:MAG: Smr/MutS family protein [Candidatus Fermentibacteria bacterium]|nr:Smr/MutS family protein [Candidatus Fermentibacteria bacterium]